MPIRSPLGLSLALAALVLAPSVARAEPPAGTWTDPPARPAADVVAPPRTETAPERAAKPSAGTADGAAAQRAEPVVRKRAVRAARTIAPRRAVAARPAKRPESVVRSATVRPVRVARPVHRDWPAPEAVVVREPMPYRPVQVYDARNPRLERLWSAEEAGYLAVRGRHVAYPDGRVLRIYRPRGEDEDLD